MTPDAGGVLCAASAAAEATLLIALRDTVRPTMADGSHAS